MNARVNGDARAFRRGAEIREHLSDDERRAVDAGKAVLVDGWGHVVDVGGAVAEDADYVLVTLGARPPAVGVVAEALKAATPALPAPVITFLARRAVALIREAGGGASVAGTAALAAAFVRRRDAAAIWGYVAGEGRNGAVSQLGKARVKAIRTGITSAVIASRDCLALAGGATVFDYFRDIRLAEVGTTNKVSLADYERRFAEVDAVAVCRRADFGIEGFTGTPADVELVAAARARGLATAAVLGGYPLWDKDLVPAAFPFDVIIHAGPPETPDADVAFYAGAPQTAGNAALFTRAAAELWRLATNR